MNESVVIIGGGINGLVAANYLARAGAQVTMLERQPRLGGACTSEIARAGGREFEYPTAATVLGFMQDFVFADTGLRERVETWAPEHPAVVWFGSQNEPCLMYGDTAQLRSEVASKWNERGRVEEYYSDFDRIVNFVTAAYRGARVPTLAQAESELGAELTQRWISGSARALLDHYFTSDFMKVFSSLDVTESGPVSLDSQYSAFTIPLMSTGTIFGGKWGFVKGGLWKLVEALGQLNEEAGVRAVTSANVLSVEADAVRYADADGRETSVRYDRLIFATDPLTAAKLLRDEDTITRIQQSKMLGTSGKVILVFRKPAVWKNDTGLSDFNAAFKFIVHNESLDALETATQAVVDGTQAYAPGYFEIYCEGAGLRKLNTARAFEYDTISVFFKNMAFNERGENLQSIKEEVTRIVLEKIVNAEDLVYSTLLTPRDLSERFFFPQGNIDHIELCAGQTFFDRNHSSSPSTNFYQFGPSPNIYYCGAASFPCGSIAGTAGYMCAQQIAKTSSIKASAFQTVGG